MDQILENKLDQFEPPEYLLSTLNRQIRELMNIALRKHGLRLVEWRILQVLSGDLQLLTVNELAELAVIERTAASRLIDKMTKQGWIEKNALVTDRRHSQIGITKAGQRLFHDTEATVKDVRAGLFSGLSARDIETLLRILAVMQANSANPIALLKG